MTKIADFPDGGWFGTLHANETEHRSGHRDPSKARFAVDADTVESNLGGISGNLRRADGEHEERALLMFRLAANKQDGAFYLEAYDAATGTMREILYGDKNGLYTSLPIHAPAFKQTHDAPIPPVPASELWSSDQQYLATEQSDGNFVVYRRNADGTLTPRWSRWGDQ